MYTVAALVLLTGVAGADPALIDTLLSHSSHKVRIKAARKLARVPDPAAQRALMAALDDTHPLVRAAAANSLGRRGHPLGVASLCQLLDDRDAFVKRTARRSLKGFGGPKACPPYVRVRVTGDSEAMRGHVKQAMDARLSGDPLMRLTAGVPDTVKKGKARGYALELRIERTVERSAEAVLVSCVISQSIFDLARRSLRGSATQKGRLKLGPKASDAIIDMQLEACMDALVPVVHEGMTEFLAHSRR